MWYNRVAKTRLYCLQLFIAPWVQSMRVLADLRFDCSPGAFLFERSANLMRCKLCLKFSTSINEYGVCDKCGDAQSKVNVRLSLRYRNTGDLVAYKHNGQVLSKDEWLSLRRQLDTFYNNTTDEEIEDFNRHNPEGFKLKKGNKQSDEGFIYLLDTGTEYHKIGKAVDFKQRLQSHRAASPSNKDFAPIHVVPVFHMTKCESFLLDQFSTRPKRGKEWIMLTKDDVEWIKTLDTVTLEKLAKNY